MPEQLRADRQRGELQPGAAAVSGEMQPGAQTHAEQEHCRRAVTDRCVRRRRNAPAHFTTDSDVRRCKGSPGKREQITAECPRGDREVPARQRDRTDHGDADPDPRPPGHVLTESASEDRVPDRLGGDQRRRGRDRGVSQARHPSGEVRSKKRAGDHRESPLSCGHPAQLGSTTGECPRHEQPAGQCVAPERDSQSRRGSGRDERTGRRHGEHRDHDTTGRPVGTRAPDPGQSSQALRAAIAERRQNV